MIDDNPSYALSGVTARIYVACCAGKLQAHVSSASTGARIAFAVADLGDCGISDVAGDRSADLRIGSAQFRLTANAAHAMLTRYPFLKARA